MRGPRDGLQVTKKGTFRDWGDEEEPAKETEGVFSELGRKPEVCEVLEAK